MLDDFDRTVAGAMTSKRVSIPMGDKFIWRHVADMLRGLATQLDHFSRLPETPDLDERRMHVLVISEIDRVNRVIKQTAKQAGVDIRDGRPRDSNTKEREGNEQETAQQIPPGKIQYIDKRQY